MFRIWATDKLFQILTKGFYVDVERLKNQGEPDALDQFRKIAREIRTSIRNSYREVLRLCTLCSDYDGKSETAREFFMDIRSIDDLIADADAYIQSLQRKIDSITRSPKA